LSERTTKVNAHLIEFTDPPGVHGDASPSGGAYRATAVMTYFGDRGSDGSWTETCVLPPSERSMCTLVIKNFVARYGGR
jgi:hypothetical protein